MSKAADELLREFGAANLPGAVPGGAGPAAGPDPVGDDGLGGFDPAAAASPDFPAHVPNDREQRMAAIEGLAARAVGGGMGDLLKLRAAARGANVELVQGIPPEGSVPPAARAAADARMAEEFARAAEMGVVPEPGSPGTPAKCRGCGGPLLVANYAVADGCPCNAARGCNHGVVPPAVCCCAQCDKSQAGCSRFKRAVVLGGPAAAVLPGDRPVSPDRERADREAAAKRAALPDEPGEALPGLNHCDHGDRMMAVSIYTAAARFQAALMADPNYCRESLKAKVKDPAAAAADHAVKMAVDLYKKVMGAVL